jgi:hypothetical protein
VYRLATGYKEQHFHNLQARAWLLKGQGQAPCSDGSHLLWGRYSNLLSASAQYNKLLPMLASTKRFRAPDAALQARWQTTKHCTANSKRAAAQPVPPHTPSPRPWPGFCCGSRSRSP